MTYFSQLGKKIGIFGLGKTGISSYEALKDAAELICFDDSQLNRKLFADIYGNEILVHYSDSKWDKLDEILLSPGVPLSHEIVQKAKRFDIKITSDIEILYEECKDANFVCITGTNGKSTTTALIGHILKEAGYDYPIGGNIGMAALALPLYKPGYVLELSSFQLELLNNFQAKIAIILNITEDHLDRHHTMIEYINIKAKILTKLKTEGLAIIGIDNENSARIFQEYKGQIKNIIPFSASKNKDNIPELERLKGIHNKENIVASYIACRALGVSAKKITDSVVSFEGLPHRMQYIGSKNRLYFYNDSKATNAEAASKSLASLKNIYWLAGGIAKKGGIKNLEFLFANIKKAYLFGQAKEEFARVLENKVEYQIFDNLEKAFDSAVNDAINDKNMIKNILLAPAASSYDQFKNFEQRGEFFTKLCRAKITDDE